MMIFLMLCAHFIIYLIYILTFKSLKVLFTSDFSESGQDIIIMHFLAILSGLTVIIFPWTRMEVARVGGGVEFYLR